MMQITRRTFLQTALAGGLSVKLSAAPFSRPIGANDTIRVAIIGLGSLGKPGVGGRGRQLMKSMKTIAGVRIAALCDVDERILDREYELLDGKRAKIKKFKDMRDVFDDSEIDAVFIALPNHWHALATIWACQAGKDVYVEKPASYDLWEGRQMVNAARRYNRIVQTGTQGRSSDVEAQLAEYIQGEQLGKTRYAQAIMYKRRESIGRAVGPQPIPSSIDYNLWLGPAPMTDLKRKILHYNWHWDWATGNGEIGNNGVHYMDRCRWILGQTELPKRAMSVGGRFLFDDDGQTPNTQIALLDYDPAPIICEIRGLPEKTSSDAMGVFRDLSKGIIFQCEGGSVVSGSKKTIALDTSGQVIKRFEDRRGEWRSQSPHIDNFFEAMRSRKASDLNADIEDGHRSAGLCHMANISHRLGSEVRPNAIARMSKGNAQWADAFERFREHSRLNAIDLSKEKATLGPWVNFDSKSEHFIGARAREANQLLRRTYREPFVVPGKV